MRLADSATESARLAHEKATRAQDHVNIPEHIEVNMFADGSYDLQSHNGGYALVWNRYIPGTISQSQAMVLAFHTRSSGDSNNLEAAAVAEALRSAKKELVLVIRGFIAADPSTLETILKTPVKINIFSDSAATLGFLLRPKWARGTTLKRAILHQCIEASHDALNITEFPGLVVNVNLSWIPAHKPEFFIRLHDVADRAAREARETRNCFRQIGEEHRNFTRKVVIPHNSSILQSLSYNAFMQLAPPPPSPASIPKKRQHTKDDEDEDDNSSRHPTTKKRVASAGSAGAIPAPSSTQQRNSRRSDDLATAQQAAGTQENAGRAATGTNAAPPSAGAGVPTTGRNATPVLVSPAAEDARLARIASRVRFDPAMQQGAAFISDGTSSRLFFTNIGFRVYVLGQRRVEEVGEAKGV